MGNKSVYITGALGFIGSHVTRACLEQGWHVYGVDKMTYAYFPDAYDEFMEHPRFSFERSDINDLEFIYECDYIINTAAETHVGNSLVKSDDFVKSNINGVHHLLELIRNYRGEGKDTPTLLHFSTDEVYGDITEGEHIETDILKPSNPYSATKAAADQLITAWGRTYNLPYVILRPTNNYGIGQYIEKLIPKSIKYLSLSKRIPLHNDGTPIRNWLHAKDTAEAVITIIKSGVKNEIYNICGGYEQSNLDTVTKIIRLQHPKDITLEEEFPRYEQNVVNKYLDLSYSRQGQDVRYALNDDKLRALGWEPKAVFDKELPAIVDYYKENFIW